ncbi:MAG: J domain-containing protein [Acidimicrobiales bacterium]
MQTPHDILGVASNASRSHIVTAYRTRAQILHPDRFHDAPENVKVEAARLMRELNEAYAVVTGRPAARSRTTTGARNGGWANGNAPPRQSSRASQAPWDQAERARRRGAAAAAEARRAREASAVNGQAVARPRTARSPNAIHAGLGEALVTNKIPCRRCQSIQWLPETWRNQLDDTIYHCSVCDYILLAHRPKE